jgi:type IV pilus assembly protein PilW
MHLSPTLRPRIRATRSAGFSLVELMVAITLSLLLLGGVVAIFASSRVSYESTDQLSRVQETGRFALEQMSRHIRSAGFSGCSRQPNFISTALNSSSNLQWNFLEGPVRGFDASGSGWVPAISSVPGAADSTDGAIEGSDILVVRGPRLDTTPVMVTTSMLDPQDPLQVSATTGIDPDGGDVVMAYSCEGVAFFYAMPSGNTLLHGVTNGLPGNQFATTSYQFRRNAEVVPVETVVYFVAPSTGAVPAQTNSLWRRRGSLDAEELVQGVEQMQLEYGVDTNDDRVVDTYGRATATTNWQRVIAVRIALLVRSIDQYGNDADRRTYRLTEDTTVAAANDRRLREVFTSTVSIRNRARVD